MLLPAPFLWLLPPETDKGDGGGSGGDQKKEVRVEGKNSSKEGEEEEFQPGLSSWRQAGDDELMLAGNDRNRATGDVELAGSRRAGHQKPS